MAWASGLCQCALHCRDPHAGGLRHQPTQSAFLVDSQILAGGCPSQHSLKKSFARRLPGMMFRFAQCDVEVAQRVPSLPWCRPCPLNHVLLSRLALKNRSMTRLVTPACEIQSSPLSFRQLQTGRTQVYTNLHLHEQNGLPARNRRNPRGKHVQRKPSEPMPTKMSGRGAIAHEQHTRTCC